MQRHSSTLTLGQKSLLIGVVLWLFVLPSFAAQAQHSFKPLNGTWPMFQHDNYHSGESPFSGIASHPLEIWNVPLPVFSNGEKAQGMSVGPDGTVYVSHSGRLHAVNPQNGQINWTCEFADNSRSTPFIADSGLIYWGYGDSFVAITTTGQAQWGWANLTGNYIFASSPVADKDGNIYFSHDGLWSLTHDGNLRWFYPYGGYSHSSPAIGPDGTIYVSGYLEFLAFQPDGSVKWSLPIEPSGNSPAISTDGTVYIGIYNEEIGKPAKLVAVNPNGSIKWSFILDDGVYMIAMPPAIGLDGTIYVGSAASYHMTAESYFYAINADGTLKWKFPVHSRDSQNWVPFFLSPPVIDKQGQVYICSHNSSCYGLTPSGTVLWEIFFPPDANGTPTWVDTAPLFVEDGKMIVLDSHDHLHAYVRTVSTVYLPLVFR